jgi:phosphate starvation-inducible protein PhoH and related proteins
MSRKKQTKGTILSLDSLKNSTRNENGNGTSSGTEINRENIKLKHKIFLTAKSQNQREFLRAMRFNIITIASGPCGTGKTRLSVLYSLREFLKNKFDRIIYTRPCIEANGENLGFLPGDLSGKIQPYMIPIFDFLVEFMEKKDMDALLKEGTIQTIPLAYQRGMNFRNSFVLLDEAQNTTPQQVRMFLTRIGENCKVVMSGDPDQSDIKTKNGLVDAIERLQGVNGLEIIKFGHEDIVRHPIVAEIEEKYKKDKGL